LRVTATSPAKIILFGEHFVVNGNTAISMAIDIPTIVSSETTIKEGVTITSKNLKLEAHFSFAGALQSSAGSNAEQNLRPVFAAVQSFLDTTTPGIKITINSHVPVGMGLGSSAATAVATLASIASLMRKTLQKEQIFQAAYALEKIIHGRPSGVDQATVTYGGLIAYRNGRVESTFSNLPKSPSLVIGSTRKRRSTAEYVGKVTNLLREHPNEYARISQQAQRISDQAAIALREGRDRTLGALMDENQNLLEIVGVSSQDLDKLILAARTAGAFGAKLTGGGGGGCMIALVDNTVSTPVTQAIKGAGGEIIQGSFTPHGVTTNDWSY
jgi:mevalonate kinase